MTRYSRMNWRFIVACSFVFLAGTSVASAQGLGRSGPNKPTRPSGGGGNTTKKEKRDLTSGSGLMTVRQYELETSSSADEEDAEDPIVATLTGVVREYDASVKLGVRQSARITLGGKEFKPEDLGDISLKGMPMNVQWDTEKIGKTKKIKMLRTAQLSTFGIEGEVGELEEGGDSIDIRATPASGVLWPDEQDESKRRASGPAKVTEPKKKKLNCSSIPDVSRVLDGDGQPISVGDLLPDQKVQGTVAMINRSSAVIVELRVVTDEKKKPTREKPGQGGKTGPPTRKIQI